MNALWPHTRTRAGRWATAFPWQGAPTPPARLLPAVLALGLLFSLTAACATSPPRKQPHRGIERLWSDFRSLPQPSALALAGDPDGIWVAGAASGESSQAAAEQAALAACAAKRGARRMQSPCRLYATDGMIVWPGW